MRNIYKAARGRQFATQIGFIPAGQRRSLPFCKRRRSGSEARPIFCSRLSLDFTVALGPSRRAEEAIAIEKFAIRKPHIRQTDLPAASRGVSLIRSHMTTTMTNLPIHITTHHLSLSDSLRGFARKKIAPLTRFANDALAAEIVLRRHNGAAKRFSASARLALPGRDVHGRGIDANLYVAIGKLVAALGRRLRKRKTRLAKKFERADSIETLVKRPKPPAEPRLLPAPAGKLRKPRLREGGQEMRVFPFRRSVPFANQIIDNKKLLI